MEFIRAFIIVSVAGAVIGALAPAGKMKKSVIFICSIVSICVVIGYVTTFKIKDIGFEGFNTERYIDEYEDVKIKVAEGTIASEFESLINDKLNVQIKAQVDIVYENDEYILSKVFIRNCPMELQEQIAEYISCSSIEFDDGG